MKRFSILVVAASFLSSCAEEPATSYLGYVEGEYVYVASPLGGELRQLEVARGSEVEAGDVLFQLDPNPEVLQIEEAEQRVRQAQARLTDLEKGRRPTEIAAIESRLRSARTAMDRAERDYERRRELYDAGQTDVVSDEELAGYRADRDVRRSEVTTLEADLETARLGGREDAVEAARIEVEALEAALSERRWKLGEKTATAASAGWIQDTLYRAGEYVPAARPVVSLLPPENVKVRFFVPQDILPTLSLGDRVDIRFDGMENPVRAEISFLSSEAEFTPPVIYSQDSRTKLVFLVEATPDPSAVNALRPGQPVDVDLNGASR